MHPITTQAFGDELHKIAKRKASKEPAATPTPDDMMDQGIGLATGGALGREVMREGVNPAFSLAVRRAARAENALPDDLGPVVRGVVGSSPVPVIGGSGSYFAPPGALTEAAKKELPKGFVSVGTPGSLGVLGHEVGHAQTHEGRLGRLLQSRLTSKMSKYSPYASPLAGVAIGAGTENLGTGLAASSAVPLMLNAPELLAEGIASVRGISGIRRHGATPAQLRAAKRTLRNAFGTYASVAGGDVAGSLAGYGVGRGLRGVVASEE